MAITIKGKGAAIGKATVTKQESKEAAPVTETEIVAAKETASTGEMVQADNPKDAMKFDGSDEPTRVVKIAMGFTKNLGDYQSARFDVGIEIPCLESYTDATADFATEWVNARLEKLLED